MKPVDSTLAHVVTEGLQCRYPALGGRSPTLGRAGSEGQLEHIPDVVGERRHRKGVRGWKQPGLPTLGVGEARRFNGFLDRGGITPTLITAGEGMAPRKEQPKDDDGEAEPVMIRCANDSQITAQSLHFRGLVIPGPNAA